MRIAYRKAIMAACAIAYAAPSAAQTDDWDLEVNPADKLTMASLAYDTGLSLAVACKDGQFNVITRGLPSATGPTRTITQKFPSKPEGQSRWVVYGDGTIAFATSPTITSRELMAGGEVALGVPGDAGNPGKTYAISLPEHSQAVRQVMEACARPLVKPVPEDYPDDSLPFNPRWTTRPNPTSIPFEVNMPTYVYVNCQTGPEGRVQNCFIDSAHPWHDRVNEYILRRAGRGVLVDGNTNQPYPVGLEFTFEVPIR